MGDHDPPCQSVGNLHMGITWTNYFGTIQAARRHQFTPHYLWAHQRMVPTMPWSGWKNLPEKQSGRVFPKKRRQGLRKKNRWFWKGCKWWQKVGSIDYFDADSLKTYGICIFGYKQMKFGGLWIFMEFQIINVFMSIYSICQLHFHKPFGFLCSWKHLPRFWNAPKCWEHSKKRVDESGQQCRSAFDITDQRDVFLSISSDPTWIPWYFEEKLCADGFLWRRNPHIFWVTFFLTKTFWYMSLLAVWFPIYSTVTLSSQNVPWGSENLLMAGVWEQTWRVEMGW